MACVACHQAMLVGMHCINWNAVLCLVSRWRLHGIMVLPLHSGLLSGIVMHRQGSFAVAMGLGGLKASRSLHNSLLTGILRFPMRFFDSTPTGRLLNRFSKDTQQMDLTLPMVSSSISCITGLSSACDI